MTARLPALGLVAAVLVALAALAVACGGDEDGNGGAQTPTAPSETPDRSSASAELLAYYTEIEGIAVELRATTRPLFQTLASSNDLTALKDAFGQLGPALAVYIDAMGLVEPPAEPAAAHAEVVAAAQAFLWMLASVNDDVRGVVGLNEFVDTASNVELPPASQTLETACDALEAVLLDGGIGGPDLACGAI